MFYWGILKFLKNLEVKFYTIPNYLLIYFFSKITYVTTPSKTVNYYLGYAQGLWKLNTWSFVWVFFFVRMGKSMYSPTIMSLE